jgi:hypothetical protein
VNSFSRSGFCFTSEMEEAEARISMTNERLLGTDRFG